MSYELWLPVINFEDSYEVSDLGNVRSIDRIVIRRNGAPMPCRGRIISAFRSPPTNYLTVSLKRNGQKINRRVHTLVAESFLGPRPIGLVVCHGPGGMDDNSPGNLRWDTVTANMFDEVRAGTHHNAKKTHCKRGHELNSENTYIKPSDGGRQCKPCQRLLSAG